MSSRFTLGNGGTRFATTPTVFVAVASDFTRLNLIILKWSGNCLLCVICATLKLATVSWCGTILIPRMLPWRERELCAGRVQGEWLWA